MLNKGNFPRAIDFAVAKYVDEEVEGYESFIDTLYTRIPHEKRPYIRVSGRTSFAMASKHTGSINYDDVYEKGYKDLFWERYSIGCEIDEDTIHDDQQNSIENSSRDLGKSIMDRREYRHCANFGYGYTTADDLEHDLTMFDGQALFSASHNLSNVDDCPTQSNYDTLKLTTDNLALVRRRMRMFRSDRNLPINIIPNLLVIGSAWETKADEIVESLQKSHEMSNTMNWNKGFKVAIWRMIDLMPYPYMWMVLCTPLAKKHCFTSDRLEEGAVRTQRDRVMDTFGRKYAADTKFLCGIGMEWRFAYGCFPTSM